MYTSYLRYHYGENESSNEDEEAGDDDDLSVDVFDATDYESEEFVSAISELSTSSSS